MSTPTAIEIVRAYLDTRVKKWGTQADVDLDCALGSVLRDAERYKALERAHKESLRYGWGHFPEFDEPHCMPGTLAELADELRSETK